jgi:hypothetical protein
MLENTQNAKVTKLESIARLTFIKSIICMTGHLFPFFHPELGRNRRLAGGGQMRS